MALNEGGTSLILGENNESEISVGNLVEEFLKATPTPVGVTMEGPYCPSRQKTGTSPYTRNGERLFTASEMQYIASLFHEGYGQQEVMSKVQFYGNFIAFAKSIELTGYRLVRLIQKGKKGRYYTKKRAMTPLEVYTLQEIWLKPHSLQSSVEYMGNRFGQEFRSSTRLLNTLKRSGYTVRNAVMTEEHWQKQVAAVKAMRERLEQEAG
jgi:hypothetical protein